MVTKREKVPHYNLEISMEPIEEKPFYLSGDSPSFKVVIENNTSKKRQGKIVVRWRLANVQTFRVVTFDLDSFANGRYEIESEWLYREGTGVYDLIIMHKSPEQYADVSDENLSQECNAISYSIHPLCSYYVRDKDLYEYEENYRKTIKKYYLIIIGLTIVNVVLVIMNQIKFIHY